MNEQDFLNKLRALLSDRPWLLRNSNNIAKLAACMDILERHGLAGLNSRLLQSPNHFLETLAEVNVTMDLIGLGFSSFRYEPPVSPKPPDLQATKCR